MRKARVENNCQSCSTNFIETLATLSLHSAGRWAKIDIRRIGLLPKIPVIMGQMLGSYHAKEVGLYMDDKPSFDPRSGFNYERKQREMIAKEADLISAKIPIEYRDYCAHHLLEYQSCRYKNMPMLYKCAHEKHAYLNCERDDYVLRMKEFERERRLRLREQRVVGAA